MSQVNNIEDYLDEDPIIPNQLYVVLSYILPDKNKNEIDNPIIKVRGSYRTVEDCNKRINLLKKEDTYFDILITEVGKYQTLLPRDDLILNENTDVKYSNDKLNDFIKSYKQNRKKSEDEFDNQRIEMSDKAKYEGTHEFQETPAAVRQRIKFTNDEIIKIKENMVESEKNLIKLDEILELSNNQMKDFTEEELSKDSEYNDLFSQINIGTKSHKE